jgi:hypothetical protein
MKSTCWEHILEKILSTSKVGPILALIAPSPLLCRIIQVTKTNHFLSHKIRLTSTDSLPQVEDESVIQIRDEVHVSLVT